MINSESDNNLGQKPCLEEKQPNFLKDKPLVKEKELDKGDEFTVNRDGSFSNNSNDSRGENNVYKEINQDNLTFIIESSFFEKK